MGCLDTFGRPRGESPEKKQSVAQWRSLLGVPLCVNNSHNHIAGDHPLGVPVCVNNSHNQRVWQLQSTLEIIPNHSICRSEKKDQRVAMTCLFQFVNSPVGWCTWRPSQGPSPGQSASILPATVATLPGPESVVGIMRLWICSFLWWQIPSNHNLEPEPTGKKPNLSLCFQFCQKKKKKVWRYQEQCQC